MMREIIERFRYRFSLWQREQREDLVGAGRPSPLEDSRDTSHYRDLRNVAIITESTSRFAVRVATVFSGGIAILGIVIYGLMAIIWPSARNAADIVMLVLGAVWSFGVGFTVLDMCIARRKHRDRASKEI